MPYYTNLAAIARRTGFPVVEQPGWRNRGHGPLSAVRSIICHHDAANQSATTFNWVVQNGRSDLPGPLAQFTLRRDGTIHVVAAGLSYHAGSNINPSLYGNSYAIGIEAGNNGIGEPWPPRQYSAYVALCAELCRAFGLTPSRVRGHKEIAPGRKIDPAGINMVEFRNKVQQYLNRGGGGSAAPGREPGGFEDMAFSDTFETKYGRPLRIDDYLAWSDYRIAETHKVVQEVRKDVNAALEELKRERSAVGNPNFKATMGEYSVNADHYGYRANKRIDDLEKKLDAIIAKLGEK